MNQYYMIHNIPDIIWISYNLYDVRGMSIFVHHIIWRNIIWISYVFSKKIKCAKSGVSVKTSDTWLIFRVEIREELNGSNLVLTQNQMHMPSCENDIFRWLFVLTPGFLVYDSSYIILKIIFYDQYWGLNYSAHVKSKTNENSYF